MSKFETFDYVVIVIYLFSILAIGVYFSGRQKSLKEYFHASGTLPWWAVGISILATGLSPISYLAGPGWIFIKDSRNSFASSILGLALVPLTAAIWLPLWSRMRVLSIYEFLELRFQPWVRTVGAVLFLIYVTFWVGTALGTAGMGFEQVTGFSAYYCIIVISVLGTVYTVLGGLRAVVWTDVAQFVVFMLGYGMILVTLLHLFDWQPLEIYRIASETISTDTGHPHTKLISFELDPNVEATIWVLLFVRLFVAVSWGASQWEVQRLHATGSRREMLKSMYAGCFWLILFTCISVPASWGFVAFYAENPDLKAAISEPDQVLPDFVVTQLPQLFRSLIMAGVLAALMSTLDSSINSMGSVTMNDFVRRYWIPKATEKQLVFVAKCLTCVFGTLLMIFALWQLGAQSGTAQEKLGKITNVIAATMPSFFLLGLLSRRTNTGGACIGALAGITFALVFNGIPGMMDAILPGRINWMWIPGISTVVNLTFGYTASYLFPPPSTDVLKMLYKQ